MPGIAESAMSAVQILRKIVARRVYSSERRAPWQTQGPSATFPEGRLLHYGEGLQSSGHPRAGGD
jgi:hypothetical protein